MEHITVKEITEAAGGRLLAGDPSALVTEISIDSREAGKGCLFVPLIGEKKRRPPVYYDSPGSGDCGSIYL